MDKREFLKTSFIAGAGAMFAGPAMANRKFFDPENAKGDGFKQYELPYSYDALAPNIDAKTMELHYSKHHAGYTAKFNAAVRDEGLEGKSLKEIFANVSEYSSSVRNNGGGFYNHNLYWKIMSPDGGGVPKGKLMRAIEKEFGSFGNFREKFSSAAGSVFGSGWAWLIEKDGKLMITTTPNQDNPLMDIAGVKGKPLMCIDVWEHAYYLNYQNKRGDYIQAFWNVIDWKAVGERLM